MLYCVLSCLVQQADDAELAAIRARRLAEMQAGGGMQGHMNPQQQQQMEEQRQAQEERRAAILSQVLEPDARERLSRIAMVKPDKARQVEDMILRAAQTGQLGSKIDEKRLIQLLEQITEAQHRQTKITVHQCWLMVLFIWYRCIDGACLMKKTFNQ